MDPRPPAVSLVVPVYGCAEHMPELTRRAGAALAQRQGSGVGAAGWEVVFVDDASPDDAWLRGRRLAAADPTVRCLRLDRNRGQQAAVLAGLARARGGWVVVMDGDLQDPPEAIHRLLTAGDGALPRGDLPDAVFAGRRGRYQGWGRHLVSALFRRARHRLCGVPRDAGLFVALRRPLVDVLVAGCRSRPRLVPMIGLSGRPLLSVPVERHRRAHGRSSYSSWRRLESGLAELAWALARRCGVRPGRPVDPASWIADEHPPSDAPPHAG